MGTYRGWPCLLTLVFTAASAGADSPWVETRTFYTNAEGLPDTEVLAVAATSGGDVYVGAPKGLARLSRGQWVTVPALAGTRVELLVPDGPDLLVATSDGLHRLSAKAATRFVKP
ncbi:MAG TPA: hypothetical protein VLE22_15920 [Bryobacteraceae bacterium]|nr:hypothetical protein [Bryobacteraceae bacterium]